MSEEAETKQQSEDTDQPSGPMQIEISPSVWAEFLDMVNLGDLVSPVEVFFKNDATVSVRASDKTKSVQYILPEWTLFGATVTNAKSIVIDPLELLADMSKFKKSREITIDIEDSVMTVYDDKQNEIVYHLKAASSAVTIPQTKCRSSTVRVRCCSRKRLRTKKATRVFSKVLPIQLCKSIRQIQKSVDDMVKHTKTEYVEFFSQAKVVIRRQDTWVRKAKHRNLVLSLL